MSKETKTITKQPAIRKLTKEEMLMVSGGRGASNSNSCGWC
ncbi:hypothetical protein ACG74X_19525 [Marivita sp. S0852]